MDKIIRDALEESIRKIWIPRARGDTVNKDCPLCRAVGRDCTLCPVYEKTGHAQCRATPYREWKAAVLTCCFSEKIKAAQEMVAFLESLLPEEERRERAMKVGDIVTITKEAGAATCMDLTGKHYADIIYHRWGFGEDRYEILGLYCNLPEYDEARRHLLPRKNDAILQRITTKEIIFTKECYLVPALPVCPTCGKPRGIDDLGK